MLNEIIRLDGLLNEGGLREKTSWPQKYIDHVYDQVRLSRVFTERAADGLTYVEGFDSDMVISLRALPRDVSKHPLYGPSKKWNTAVEDVPQDLVAVAFEEWLWRRAKPKRSGRLTRLRNRTTFPSFSELLAQIQRVNSRVRLFLQVKDVDGQNLPMFFYTERRGMELEQAQIKKGHTVVVLQAEQYSFAFDGPAIRHEESPMLKSEFALPPGITTPELPPPGLLPPGLDEKLRVKNSNHLKVADVATLINLLYVPQVDGTDFFTFEIGDRAIRELVDKEPTLMNVNDVEKLAYRWGVEFRLAALVEWAKVRKLLVKHLRQQWEEIREKEDSTKERLGMHLWHFNTEIDLIMTVLRNRSRLLSDEQKVYFRYIWREMDYWWMNRTDVGTDFELFHLYDPTFAHRLGHGLELLANEYEACDRLVSGRQV
ncbi:hypothetical protein ED733_001409 [Metarhizium rileyi]|uniref:Uncharacterized protein n=1 Tax=Metarhizium rileyi (strain RCEF 4871) TaxID=1649241 RepID=A0A5C6G072_METRR|nr:hypothetical protein ED733_001409 [Metarhizium rileyi]